MRVSLSWLQEFTDCRQRTAEELAVLLTMSGLEVEDITHLDAADAVLTLGVTPNRPDCLSVRGVAREIAAICKGRLRAPAHRVPAGEGVIAGQLHVEVLSPERCPRYAAWRVEGVQIRPSPPAVQARLQAVGIKPINNVVDATNYVLWELGQPLHAFDARFIHGDRIVVRAVEQPSTFTTLDGHEQALVAGDLLICDALGPVALAGIMGGANSEVRDDTSAVIIESAYFAPSGIRRTSKRLGLHSESSRRFERGVDPNGAVEALHRAVTLILQWSGGAPSSEDWIDCYPDPIAPRTIQLSVTEIARVLGVTVPPPEAKGILCHLGMEVSGDGGTWDVNVPTFRPDLERPIDLIEEIARIHGYDRIPASSPKVPLQIPRVPGPRAVEDRLRERLVAHGFCELIHYPFAPATELRPFLTPGMASVPIQNPLGQEPTELRTSLAAGLLQAANRNLRHGGTGLRGFEFGAVYHRMGSGELCEQRRLAGILVGSRHPMGWTQVQDMLDFFDAKAVVEQIGSWTGALMLSWTADGIPSWVHPGRAAGVRLEERSLGYCGELHPEIARTFDITTPAYLFELDFDFLGSLAHASHAQYRRIPRHPSIRRDLSVLLDDTVAAGTVQAVITGCQEPWITDVTLFDLYAGERLPAGKKSLAFALRYQAADRTLTDDEVNTVHERVTAHVVQHLGVSVRA